MSSQTRSAGPDAGQRCHHLRRSTYTRLRPAALLAATGTTLTETIQGDGPQAFSQGSHERLASSEFAQNPLARFARAVSFTPPLSLRGRISKRSPRPSMKRRSSGSTIYSARCTRCSIDRGGFNVTGSKPSRNIRSSSHPRATSEFGKDAARGSRRRKGMRSGNPSGR